MRSSVQDNPSSRELLFNACHKGDKERVRHLITLVDLMATDSYGRTALHVAARANQEHIVDTLLGQSQPKFDVNVKDCDGQTALITASKYDHRLIAHILLDYGADINLLDKHGRSALSMACLHNSQNIIDRLLTHQDIEVNAHAKYSALHWVVQGEHDQALRLLISKAKARKLDLDLNAFDKDGMTPLSAACMKRSATIAEVLIEGGANVNCLNEKKQSCLYLCCGHDLPEVARVLLTNGAQVNVSDMRGNTPLHVAIQNSSRKCIELLSWHQDTDLNKRDHRGRTPLWLACGENLKDVMCHLIRKGVNINAADNEGYTPLHILAIKNNYDLAYSLLKESNNTRKSATCDFNAEDQNQRSTTHPLTAEKSYVKDVSTTLPHGAYWETVKNGEKPLNIAININASDHQGCTALHCMAKMGYTRILDLLINYGADINGSDCEGRTSLHLAAKAGNTDVVRLLLSRGVNVNHVDQKGRTALHYAAAAGNVDFVKLWISSGFKVNDANVEGRTALHMAAYAGSRTIVALLLDSGVEVDWADKKGRTALHTAVARGNKDVVTFLLEEGACVNAKDYGKHTVLHYSCSQQSAYESVVELLLDRRAMVNDTDNHSQTALHHAATQGHVNIVKLLIKWQADSKKIDKGGNTAKELAALKKHSEVVRILSN